MPSSMKPQPRGWVKPAPFSELLRQALLSSAGPKACASFPWYFWGFSTFLEAIFPAMWLTSYWFTSNGKGFSSLLPLLGSCQDSQLVCPPRPFLLNPNKTILKLPSEFILNTFTNETEKFEWKYRRHSPKLLVTADSFQVHVPLPTPAPRPPDPQVVNAQVS